MSMTPNFVGRRSNTFDHGLPAWDPFEGWPIYMPRPHLPPPMLMPMPMPMPMPIPRPVFGLSFPPETASFAHAAVDWKETPTAHVFTAEVPGLRKEEVKVKVNDDRILHISGERSRHQEDTGDGYHRMESSSGSFSRQFQLPENAKVEQLKVTMHGGVLTVTVPKAEPPKRTNARTIEISG